MNCHVEHQPGLDRYRPWGVAEFASMRSSTPPAAAHVPAGNAILALPGERDHDTARGPGGPCSVAARSPG